MSKGDDKLLSFVCYVMQNSCLHVKITINVPAVCCLLFSVHIAFACTGLNNTLQDVRQHMDELRRSRDQSLLQKVRRQGTTRFGIRNL